MARLRSRAPTVAAIASVVGAWIACGPLTSQRSDQVTGGSAGLDGGVKIADAIADFDGPADIATEGGSADAPPFDAVSDTPTEGGQPDGAPFDAAPFDAFTNRDGSIIIVDARPDAPPPDAGVPDAAIADASVPRDVSDVSDSGANVDAAGSAGTSFAYDNISFYDCRCAGSGAPVGGWPILGAIAVVIVRRRRGSSSAR
jgi:hypothetical protein